MKSLAYLFFTTMKNSLKELIKHPSRLIMYLIFIGLIVLVVVSSQLSDADTASVSYRSLNEFGAIVLALYTAMFVLMAHKGLTSGASFFSMPDVNLLFLSPVSPIKILLFGIVKQMGTSLMVGLFIFYQYSWMHNTYGISFGMLLFVFLGYCLTVFCAQLTAMAIYSFSCNSENRKKAIKGVLYAAGLLCAAYLVYPVLASGSSDLLGTVADRANSGILEWIPVAGWLKGAVIGALTAGSLHILTGFGLTLAYAAIVILLIAVSNTDYYEDVLQATEITYTAITAQKQGKAAEAIPKNVKVGRTGIGRGFGASTFFYKHLLENRRAGMFYLDISSIIFIVANCIFAFFMKDQGIIAIFAFVTYMQALSSFAGRWLKELLLPYVYLTPVSPFKKLISICGETLLKSAVESVVLYILIGFIIGASPVDIAFCIVARVGFSYLFMAVTILLERLFGSMTNRVMIILLYFLMVLIIAAPGMILGGILMVAIQAGFWLFLLCSLIWNLGIGSLIFYLCRNILNYAELNNQ